MLGRRMAIVGAMAAVCSGLVAGTCVTLGATWLLGWIVPQDAHSTGAGPRSRHPPVSARMGHGPDTDAAPQSLTHQRLASPSSAPGAPLEQRALGSPGDSIRVGERLTYALLAGGIKVGEAEFAIEAVEDEELGSDGGGAFRVSFRARTSRFASLFYKVETSATSTVERSSLRSLGYELAKLEDAHYTEVRIVPDYLSGFASTVRADDRGDPVKRSLEIPASVQDPVSWFYGVRGMRLEEGSPGAMTVVISSRVSPVPLAVDGVEEFVLSGGTRLRGVQISIPGGGGALMGREGDVALLLEERTMIPLQVLVSDERGACGLRLISANNSPLNNVDSTETSVVLAK